jgi:hypothetical protein
MQPQVEVADNLATEPMGDGRLVKFAKHWAAHRLITE